MNKVIAYTTKLKISAQINQDFFDEPSIQHMLLSHQKSLFSDMPERYSAQLTFTHKNKSFYTIEEYLFDLCLQLYLWQHCHAEGQALTRFLYAHDAYGDEAPFAFFKLGSGNWKFQQGHLQDYPPEHPLPEIIVSEIDLLETITLFLISAEQELRKHHCQLSFHDYLQQYPWYPESRIKMIKRMMTRETNTSNATLY